MINNQKIQENVAKSEPLEVRGEPVTFTSDGKPKSYQYDDVWDFSSEESGLLGGRHIVTFRTVNPEYIMDIQDVLKKIKDYITQQMNQPASSSQLDSHRLGLSHISEILGHTRWELLNDNQEYKRFKKNLKKRAFGKKTIETNIVVALNKLFESGYLNRHIDGRELVNLAVATTTEQAIAIPIGMYQQLLSKSISVVEKYHSYRHDISNVMEKAYEIQDFIHNENNAYNKHYSIVDSAIKSRVTRACRCIPCSVPDFKVSLKGGTLNSIQVACMVVTLAFSGVRISEARSFNQDSYKEKKITLVKRFTILNAKPIVKPNCKIGSAPHYLSKFIRINTIASLVGKTTKGNCGILKTATWQTHPVVKAALELAEDMTASLRQRYVTKIGRKISSGEYDEFVGRKKLNEVKSAFISVDITHNIKNYVRKSISVSIQEQAKKWGIKSTKEDVAEFDLLNENREGTLKLGCFLPKLSPHDFRRTFAVFFRRYNFGSAAGIKFQFKHHNINMSKYYANNAELMRMNDILIDTDLLNELNKAGIELGVDIYDDIYNKSENLSGISGNSIAKSRLTKLNNGYDVYMTRADIEKHLRNGDFAIVQLPTGGYCTNPSCDRICGTSLFKADKKDCIHQIITDKSAKKMALQRKRLIKQFQDLNMGDKLKNSILAGLKQKIQDIEITLEKHNIEYGPFKDMIKGVAA